MDRFVNSGSHEDTDDVGYARRGRGGGRGQPQAASKQPDEKQQPAPGCRACSDFKAFDSEGKPVQKFKEAQTVILKIAGSKTDKYNRGEFLAHQRSGDSELCPITCLEALQFHFPDRFTSGANDPLLRWQRGSPLLRVQLQVALERAAEALGTPSDTIGSHSLRFGGATALYAQYQDTGLVQRWGRWSSDAFQGYLWDSHQSSAGVAKAMAAAKIDIC